MNKKTVWDDNHSTVDVPKDVAICPECGSSVQVEVYETEQGEDGNWGVAENGSGVHIMCAYAEFSNTSHYAMPYVDWLPLDKPVIDWLNRTYDFNPF